MTVIEHLNILVYQGRYIKNKPLSLDSKSHILSSESEFFKNLLSRMAYSTHSALVGTRPSPFNRLKSNFFFKALMQIK